MWLHYENKLLYLVNITEPAGSLKIWGQSVKCKVIKSSPLLGPFCGSEFLGFSQLKI